MRCRFAALSCAAIVLVAAATLSPANAQVLYGSIVGTVEDPSGAIIPGATITLVSRPT
jgi:hypothetical protein